MTKEFRRFRIDFVLEVVSVDEETREFTARLDPDPRRYEWREIKGERYLYDRFDDIYIPEKVFYEQFTKIRGLPIYFQPPKIKDAEAYIKSRRPLIANMLKGIEPLPTFEDKSEEFLQSLAVNKLAFVIISLDIVGSTKLAAASDPKTYAQLISTVLYELSEVIPKFHGHVLKYTGDGLIAYFPEPSFITKNDLAIDCALTLRGLVYKALNPIFKEQGFPPIDIRIGLDAGEAYVETIGSPETKQHKDIIGEVVNLATKIQAQAKPGEIYLGDVVERNLHITWRQICEPVKLGRDWDYKDFSGKPYKVHRVKLA
jgi:class 3 adenylate cyclase